MTNDDEPDPLLLSLTRLTSAFPRGERDERIRARCHAALARQQAARTRARRGIIVARVADAALTAMLCGYATMAALQAFRLIH